MYACVHETGDGFFKGVCTPSSTTAHPHDPPPAALDSRTDSERHALAVPSVQVTRMANTTFRESCLGKRGAYIAFAALTASSSESWTAMASSRRVIWKMRL